MATKWRQVFALWDILSFVQNRSKQREEEYLYGNSDLEKALKLPYRVYGPQIALVEFTDETAIACVSAYEQSGCDTCGSTESWAGFYIKDIP